MGILCDTEIRALCAEGLVDPYDPALVNPASLDVRLGENILVEAEFTPEMQPRSIARFTQEYPFLLQPQEFILAETVETFFLPSFLAGQFALKSSRARSGIEHLMAGYCDPGWQGSKLTLELQNARSLHPVALWPGMRIGQIVFHAMSARPAEDYSIVGHYNFDQKVTAAKL
jgi:dCTP deaminase